MGATDASVAAHAARVSAMTAAWSAYGTARTAWVADKDNAQLFLDMVTAWVAYSKAHVDVHVADAGYTAAEATRRKDLLDIVQAKANIMKTKMVTLEQRTAANLDTSTASTELNNAKADVVTALTNYVGEWTSGGDD